MRLTAYTIPDSQMRWLDGLALAALHTGARITFDHGNTIVRWPHNSGRYYRFVEHTGVNLVRSPALDLL
jgi:hypothetical protein